MAGALRPRTEAARKWAEEHAEATRLIEQAIERDQAKKKEEAERPIEVWMRFRCVPSVLEDIKLVVASYPTSDRVVRFRTLGQPEAERPDDSHTGGWGEMDKGMSPKGRGP